jgi:tetratricopeptide (TPR) repeat protein
MLEPPEGADEARERVRDLTDRWKTALTAMAQEARQARTVVDRALADAASTDAYDDLERMLARVTRRATRVTEVLEEVASRVRLRRSDWAAEHRWDPREVATLTENLAANLSEDPHGVARRWLGELFDALDARRWDVVEVLTGKELAWPDDLGAGAHAIREAVRAWHQGDFERGLVTMAAVGRGEEHGLEGVLTPQLRSRAHRLAAWIALRCLGDRSAALDNLEQAVRAYPRGGRMHAERAAYFLFVGELDRGANDAQHAIELAVENPYGYFELGIWAELTGDYEGADALYGRGLELMATAQIARIHTQASLIDPPGRLLLAAAGHLLALDRPVPALELADEALAVGVRGAQTHPEAEVHHLRSLALERSDGPPREAATAAMQSGRLSLWNGEPDRAIAELERAVSLDDSLDEAGWLLADALLSTSLPLGETLPIQGSVSGARDRWEGWKRKIGPPRRETSWAYLTRAIIADLMTQRPGADRAAGVWEALAYVERALVHDDVDAQRWGYAAQYLRYAGLEELAFEAVSRGYELSAGDRQVLAERLPLLANRGELDAAETAADELARTFGPDPWVMAVRAWLAMHLERFARALELLELPIAEGNNPAWYYEMRAVCHVALGDVAAARVDYQTLRTSAPPIDGTTKCRLAVAELACGDREKAKALLRQAEGDPTTWASNYLIAAALVALTGHDPAGAERLLEDALDSAKSKVEVDDIVTYTKLHLRGLGDDHLVMERERALARMEKELAPRRRAALEQRRPNADSELEAALRQHDHGGTGPDLDAAETALLAVASRRHARNGRLGDAIAGYERLRDSAFEPEATVGLVKSLREASRVGAERGDADAVRRACARLGELGKTTPVRGALAVAEALHTAGRLEEARDYVAAHADEAIDDEEHMAVERRLGALEVELGDLEAGTRHFESAFAVAERMGDRASGGQVQVRLALVAALRRDQTTAKRHLEAALSQWSAAGATEPTGSLLEEVRRLRQRALLERHWSRLAGEALDWIETELTEQLTREYQPA